MCAVCLSVFFCINATEFIDKPSASMNISTAHMVAAYSQAGWSLLQMLTAIAYVVCITVAGLKLNESTRLVLDPVMKLRTVTDRDRFAVHRVRACARALTRTDGDAHPSPTPQLGSGHMGRAGGGTATIMHGK